MGKNSIMAEIDTTRAGIAVDCCFTRKKNPIEIDVSLQPVVLDGYISKHKRGITAELNGVPMDHEPYKGEYMVTPSFDEQTLNTSGKLMTNDVDVLAIPVSITSNPSGGNTVYIGG